MNVFIVYTKDMDGGTEVDKVFLSELSAVQYVIDVIFEGNSFYDKLSTHDKQDYARNLITVFEAIA